MNCQTHLFRGQDPHLVTRRWFFQQCAVGLGAVALNALLQQDGQWTDVRCRSGLGTDSAEPAMQIIAPLISKLQAGTPVFLVHDGVEPRYAEGLIAKFDQAVAKDVSGVDMLWRMIGEN